ncbi:MAG: hypothetical protein AAGF84_03170 [Planctomycetota bacterium]
MAQAPPPSPLNPPDPHAEIAPPAAHVWPEIDLRQVRRLTDDTGLIQHAVYATPDPHHGYCIDDNARALLAALRLAELGQLGTPGDEALPIHTYLQFVFYAFNPDPSQHLEPKPGSEGGFATIADAGSPPGRFRNFMGFNRAWLEDQGSEDSQGRALWALGEAVRHGPTPNVRDLAAEVYARSLPGVAAVTWPRSWAFAILGLVRYLEAQPDHEPTRLVLQDFATRLADALRHHRQDDWPWWETMVTYDNAKLPHALLLAGQALGDASMCADALISLTWLVDQQTTTDPATGATHLSVIGNHGWLKRDGDTVTKAAFDQQPLEAYALVDACLDAARHTAGEPDTAKQWEAHAWRCFGWYVGRNDAAVNLIDPHTGGCRDGLKADGVNRNQGAESTLAYLLAVLELHLYERRHPGLHGRVVDRP